MTKNNWLIFPKQRGLTKAKLICFPYAGGSAHIFHNWESSLPAGVELVLVQPPGRGHRIIEPLATSMQEWVQSLLPIITPHMSQPYVLFGHSLGSRFAFETMLQCLRLGVRPPLHFIASASRGPQFKSAQTPIWELPDAAFVAEMTKLGGTPDEVLQNEQLMALLTPMLKADFQISDTWKKAATIAKYSQGNVTKQDFHKAGDY